MGNNRATTVLIVVLLAICIPGKCPAGTLFNVNHFTPNTSVTETSASQKQGNETAPAGSPTNMQTIPPVHARAEAVPAATVLHTSIKAEFGGHTFIYLLEGDRGLFWAARLYVPSSTAQTVVIGQYPKPGSSLPPASTTISFTDPGVIGVNPPQMIRTPDGYIHVFIGVTYSINPTYNAGRIRYYRSAAPEDITTLEDRTSLLPTTPYSDFHLRMNAAVSQDGNRMALVILAISQDGSVPFNTPVIFLGQRSGPDFVFENAKPYADPSSFFYPQVVVVDAGIVVIGEDWDNHDRLGTRIIKLNGEGQFLDSKDIVPPQDGSRFCYDVRPESGKDWSNLILYVNGAPAGSTAATPTHEFWRYNVASGELNMLNSLPVSGGMASGGRLVPSPNGGYVFVNNPSGAQLYVWEGDLLHNTEAGTVTNRPIPGVDPPGMGYQGDYYISVPNPVYGSLPTGRQFYVATDCPNVGKSPKEEGPCSLLMWQMAFTDVH
jgi:hypothetical protein